MTKTYLYSLNVAKLNQDFGVGTWTLWLSLLSPIIKSVTFKELPMGQWRFTYDKTYIKLKNNPRKRDINLEDYIINIFDEKLNTVLE
jgi:hypothetical protein